MSHSHSRHDATPSHPERPLTAHEHTVVADIFDGDVSLYRAFLDSCLEQFGHDVIEGDAACQAGRSEDLRRTTHSLKGVLQTLGWTEHAALAKQVELAAKDGNLDGAREGWQRLRDVLLSLKAA